MKLFKRLAIKDAPAAALITLHEYVSNRSVALLLREDPAQIEIASAVAIQIGHHYLLATAAHNVKELNPHQIEAIPAGRRNLPLLSVSRIGIHHLSSTEDVDVAWMELDMSGYGQPGVTFVRLGQMGAFPQTRELQPCFVQGFPAEVVSKPSSPVESFFVESDGFLTLFISSDNRRTIHQPHVDIAVEYPPHDGSLDGSGVPNPPGISGGGFWLCPSFENYLIWTPDAARLAGIARGWWRSEKELLATRIECWLALVAEDFPDIRPEIRDTQSRLRELKT